MMDIGHMDTDLMSPPRFQFTFHPSIVAVALKDPEMRNGLTTAFEGHGHPYAVLGMPADGSIDDTFFFRNIAMNQGPVGPVRRMGLYLFGKAFMSFVGLGGNHDARRIFIQPMNDARPDDAIDAGQFTLTVVEQGIDQGPIVVSSCG